ncbi:hypothetical protein QCD79_35150, partial [Pseudomonas quasicaspiana]|nr:hypothetical protein [Pseudomonas quasicaspiana]
AGAWASDLAAQFGEPVPMVSGHPAMLVTEPLLTSMNIGSGSVTNMAGWPDTIGTGSPNCAARSLAQA